MEAFDAVVTETTTDNLDNEEVSVINVGKSLVAAAITKQGVAASSNNSFSTLANKIGQLTPVSGSGLLSSQYLIVDIAATEIITSTSDESSN